MIKFNEIIKMVLTLFKQVKYNKIAKPLILDQIYSNILSLISENISCLSTKTY